MCSGRIWTASILLGLVAIIQFSRAQDWPQWRGPKRDGVVVGFKEPAVWPAALKLKWRVSVGEGHSSPVVAGNRVFQLSRQGSREVVSCFDLDSGKLLWQDSYEVAYRMALTTQFIVGKHKQGPRSTPVVSGGKLYTLGVGGVLSCYDAATGKALWRKDFKDQFKNTAPEFGTAMSPLIERGLLIIHVGGDKQGALMALDAATGAVRWQWSGDGPGYASPIMVEIKGTWHIITQSQSHIISIWPNNGGLLWQLPFTTEYEQNIVTPVVYQDLLIFSGINKGVFALRPSYRDRQWSAEMVWQNNDVSIYMNSPILSGNLLFGLSHKNKGQFFCLDAATGQTLWKGPARQGENAAMVIAGQVMFWLTNDAELIVVRVSGKGYEELKRYKVAESETWAHPVIAGNRILVKDNSTLAMWGLE
jgi:outer membrane protein assembly factor BamB